MWTSSIAITQTPQTWLDNKVYELEGGLGIDWDAPVALFPPGLLENMFEAYAALLEELAVSDAAWTETGRSLIPAADRELIAGVNATAGPLPDDLLHEPVFAAAEADPEAIAVIGEGYALSFGELTHHALELAHRLRDVLEASDQLIGIVMEKGFEQIVAALAVLETGRAFLPISAGQPDQRIQAILSQAGVRIALTQPGRALPEPMRESMVTAGGNTGAARRSSSAAASANRPARGSRLRDLHFRQHRRAQGRHHPAPRRAQYARRSGQRWSFSGTDRVLWVSSLEFDLSIFDIFGILGVGGAVVVPAARGPAEPAGLGRGSPAASGDGVELGAGAGGTHADRGRRRCCHAAGQSADHAAERRLDPGAAGSPHPAPDPRLPALQSGRRHGGVHLVDLPPHRKD